MRKFMCDDFLLETETAKKLYHDFAKDMPIFDYHCHLSPKEIAENKSYSSITEIWLGGDHYKWRGMRSNGVSEDFITGDKPAREKFERWAETVPNTIGNPLYHWTHLELKRYFNIEETLSPKTSEMIWNKCNDLLATEEFTARELIKRSNVKGLCTTDDPIDDLRYHIAIKEDKSFDVKVLPTFRPDKAVNIDKEGFAEWIAELSKVVGYNVDSFTALKKALTERVEFFHEVGCRVSDHGVDSVVFTEATEEELNAIFVKGLNKEALSEEELRAYKGKVIQHTGREYARHGWTMQVHIGALRNNSTRMFKKLGPDTGYDSIGDELFAKDLSRLLDSLDSTDELPKTILYCLNPRDNYVLGTMIGAFQGGGIPGKIQFGSGWWFCDQRDGMEDQMKALANLGLLSRFVGMLTDSRSFLSYTRHEYFRRILCNLLGRWVENGEYPADFEMLEKIVKGICYDNASKYFGIEL